MTSTRAMSINRENTETGVPQQASEGDEAPIRECLIMIYGDNPGRYWRLGTDDLGIGRDPDSDLPLDESHISRHHACVAVHGGARRCVVDLDSTNGTYVNDRRVDQQYLKSGDRIHVGGIMFKYLVSSDLDAQVHKTIYELTITDGLTSLPNAFYLSEHLDREMARARRHDRPLHVLHLDIDSFAERNEDLGFVAADHVLRQVARVLSRRARREDPRSGRPEPR